MPGLARHARWAGAAVAVAGLCLSSACARKDGAADLSRAAQALGADPRDAGLTRWAETMRPAALAVARRHDPRAAPDLWGRVPGWEAYRLAVLPTLGVGDLDSDDARRINGFKPASPLPPSPAPFVLKATGAERARALQCLTQAVYYEAAAEPLAGRQAVAQTVLNRLRHPGYPKSVCGVVYEGAQRATGCQFSFTCDGSLARAPLPSLWSQAQDVARRALGGFVARDVGTATHYHADYVAPYWAPTLVKLTQIGAHIFYRWTGPSGDPRAFRAKYQGGELNLPAEVLTGADARTDIPGLPSGAAARADVTTIASPVGKIEAVKIPDASVPGGYRARVRGVLAGRAQPTRDQIDAINARLKAMEAQMSADAMAVEGTTP